MRRRVAGLLGAAAALLTTASLALAEEAAKAPDYSGISYIYYTAIIVVLAYGVYDTFLKKS